MVHHIVLFKLKPEVTPARIEEMMMNTRMQLLKIGALVTISVRRVKLAFASACPAREDFALAQRRLCV